MACQNCGRPAILRIGPEGKVALCLDCYHNLVQAVSIQQAQSARIIDYLTAEMEMTAGLPGGLFPRMEVPQPIAHAGHAFNNINVDRSLIGGINTGVIQSLDVVMSDIRAGGNEAAADALQQMTEAVITSTDLQSDQKNDAWTI